MMSHEKIHWQVVAIRRRNIYFTRDNKTSYAVELRGLYFPSEVINLTVAIIAHRPKKIRNYFYPVRSREEIERLHEI